MSKVTTRSITKNLIVSLSAQFISLSISFLTNLIVPRFISEIDYSYWQTYTLYASYVAVLHFGIFDGLVLRYSQYDYEELDKQLVRSQLYIVLGVDACIALFGIMASILFGVGPTRWIFACVSIAAVTTNVFTYTSYSFQITNRISKYATLVILQRVFFGTSIAILLLLKQGSYIGFCIFEILGSVVGIAYGIIVNKDLYFGSFISVKETIEEARINFKSGFLLLLANWSSVFVVIGAKTIIQLHWDTLTFGKVSFAFSVSNLFLSFVTAISVVLFPSIKRMDPSKLPKLYGDIRCTIVPFLFIILIAFFPGCVLLNLWLPAYSVSLQYLGTLLPLIVFSSLTSLLTNNYLKAYRKEKAMLGINFVSIVFAIIGYCFFTFVYDSISGVLLTAVFATMFRSVLSELLVSTVIDMRFTRDYVLEGLMVIAFVVCAKSFSLLEGCLIYLLCLVIYLYLERRTFLRGIKKFRKS